MADFSPNGQDLAKALDTVAGTGSNNPAQAFSSVAPAAATSGNPDYPPIVPPHSPIAPAAMQSAPGQAGQANANDMPATSPTPAVSSAYATYSSQDNSTPTASAAPIAPVSSSVPSTPPPSAGASPSTDTTVSAPVVGGGESSGPLDAIKKEALDQLRPLVGKLGVEPQEKFDTYLLLIRSTDDKNLIAPAYDAAKAIPDEAKKAEALLDIIKEIDYLSHPKN